VNYGVPPSPSTAGEKWEAFLQNPLGERRHRQGLRKRKSARGGRKKKVVGVWNVSEYQEPHWEFL